MVVNFNPPLWMCGERGDALPGGFSLESYTWKIKTSERSFNIPVEVQKFNQWKTM